MKIDCTYGETRFAYLSELVGNGQLWIDVGTGPQNTFSQIINRTQWEQVISVDIWEERPQTDYANVQYVCMDATEYEFPESDCVSLIHFIEHIREQQAIRLIDRCKATTKRIVLETPDRFESGKGEVTRWKNPHMLHHFLADRKFCEALGLKHMTSYPMKSGITNSIYFWDSSWDG